MMKQRISILSEITSNQRTSNQPALDTGPPGNFAGLSFESIEEYIGEWLEMGIQMAQYYMDEFVHESGNYEVHREGCDHMPPPDRKIYLGLHPSLKEATLTAGAIIGNVQECSRCSRRQEEIQD